MESLEGRIKRLEGIFNRLEGMVSTLISEVRTRNASAPIFESYDSFHSGVGGAQFQ